MYPKAILIAFALYLGVFACPIWGGPSTRPTTKAAEVKRVLVSKSYEVTITRRSEDGNVVDDNVTYRGVSKKSGKTITLKGSTWHTHGPDGTPSRFIGYEFRSGDVLYQVFETGHLTVIQGDRVLVDEDGKWQAPHGGT